MSPREQATNFLDRDARLVAAYEGLTPDQRTTMRVDLGFLPEPLSLASFAGMRLNESVQHSWDVRVAFDPSAEIPTDAAVVLVEHLTGDLGFLVGFIGKADALPGPAVVDIDGPGYGIVVADEVAVVTVTGAVTLDDLRRVFPGY